MKQNPHLPGTPDEFIEANMGLAQSVAWRFIKGKKKADPDDILAIAYFGLVKAYSDFDPTKAEGMGGGEVKFSTYAVPKITGEIMRHLRDFTLPVHVPRSVKDAVYKFWRLGFTGEEPISDIAAKLEISEKEAKTAIEAAKALNMDSLDREITEEGSTTLSDMISNSEDETEQVIIADFVSQLPPTMQQVFNLWINRGLKQREIASLIGISQVSVSRIEQRLLLAAEQYGREEESEVRKYPKEFKERLRELTLRGLNSSEIKEALGNEFPDVDMPVGSISGFMSAYRKGNKPQEQAPEVIAKAAAVPETSNDERWGQVTDALKAIKREYVAEAETKFKEKLKQLLEAI